MYYVIDAYFLIDVVDRGTTLWFEVDISAPTKQPNWTIRRESSPRR